MVAGFLGAELAARNWAGASLAIDFLGVVLIVLFPYGPEFMYLMRTEDEEEPGTLPGEDERMPIRDSEHRQVTHAYGVCPGNDLWRLLHELQERRDREEREQPVPRGV